MTPKKLKLNIEHISSKTKKCHKHNLTGLPKKIIKLPEAKQVKSKKYCEEGHRISAQTHDALALN